MAKSTAATPQRVHSAPSHEASNSHFCSGRLCVSCAREPCRRDRGAEWIPGEGHAGIGIPRFADRECRRGREDCGRRPPAQRAGLQRFPLVSKPGVGGWKMRVKNGWFAALFPVVLILSISSFCVRAQLSPIRGNDFAPGLARRNRVRPCRNLDESRLQRVFLATGRENPQKQALPRVW